MWWCNDDTQGKTSTFEKKYPIDSIVEGEIVNKNEYSLFVKIENLDVDAFLHCNDLTYSNNGEEELNKFKKKLNIYLFLGFQVFYYLEADNLLHL